MHKICFVTTNRHKVEEANAVLGEKGFEFEQLDYDYEEGKDDSIQEISLKGAKFCAEKFKKEVIVEDTGCEFKAYPGFPGAMPKFVIETLNYEGIFRLLEGQNRQAKFVSAIGYCKPGEDAVVFDGELMGNIGKEVVGEIKKRMPYENIFIPNGYDKPFALLGIDIKNKVSHRTIALNKLSDYLEGKK